MRIALTITELDPGGAEQCLVQLAIFLSGRGHEVHVFALGPTPDESLGSTPNRQVLTEQLSQAGIPWKIGDAGGLRSLVRVVRWLRNEMQSLRPDIIQSMLFHANVVTAIANRKLSIPHIGGARVSQPSRLRQAAQGWSAKRMMRMVCVSQQVAKLCASRESIPPSKLVVIPNGIPSSVLSQPTTQRPEELRHLLPSDETPYLIFVGRLSEQKGILQLVRKIDQVLDKLPEHHFILLGDGPLRSQIQESLSASHCPDRVHLVGWRPQAIPWIAHSSLLLLPSRYEGMPNVVLEAMSCGRPVCAFAVEGIAELLGDQSSQIVHGDLTEFVERAHLLAQPARAQELGAENRRRAETHFRLEDQFAKYEQLYVECLSTNNKEHYR